MITLQAHHTFRLLLALLVCLLTCPTFADERTLSPEQLQALENAGELDADTTARPAKLPDLTKADPIGEREKANEWPLGPTGLFGYMNGGLEGDQIEVTQVQPGSPADGVMRWGDVIIGVDGKKFVPGQNMGMAIGKAIIEAEKEENKGQLKLLVWRDRNFIARNGKRNIADADVGALIDKAQGDTTLYDWIPDDQRAQAVRSDNFKEFPIDSQVLEITLKLAVLPPYSDTSPYDCPKARRILENAWKVLEGQFEAGAIRADRGGAIAALALVASGKPEHRELVRQWVRSPNAKNWHPSIEGTMDIMKPGGYQSWRMSFDGLDCAIYYHATGDEFVLPAVREYAIHTAKGQAGGGSWGHTFAWPSFNGGQLHGMNPGYGALNAAGNRCFMLLALAKSLGIEHPEIDQAIERSKKFFGSYYEKGAVPYGHHGAAASDDSNGKNVGVAFAFKLLGDNERAKWFAQMSSHASFTRRGGHGSGYFWHYSPWAATMLGPKATIAAHRNLRWRYTLCRQFDGSFTLHSNYGTENLRNPTATYVMHYSAPMQQTLFTGKDSDESMSWSDQEFADLLTIAQGQFNEPSLFEQAGPPVAQRSTDEVFHYLGVFMPKTRNAVAVELARRYLAGEKDILPRLAELLVSDNPRLREAACRALQACGPDATLQYMSGVAKLLNDEQEFVRMSAVQTITQASQSVQTQAAVLQTTIGHRDSETMSPNSVASITQAALFAAGSKLATSPFDAGLDEDLVHDALEKILTLDPAGNRPLLGSRDIAWGPDTAARIAGPLIYAAEHEQIADQMFSSRRPNTLKFLARLGYQESIDASASYLRQYLLIPRQIRSKVYYKRGQVLPQYLMAKPGNARHLLPDLYRWLADKPLDLAFAGNKDEPAIALYELINKLEAAEPATPLPSLADDASRYFQSQLDSLPSQDEKTAFCRRYLFATESRDDLRKINSLSYLVKTRKSEAFADLLPYLGHASWRLSSHAQALAVELARTEGDAPLIQALPTARPHTAEAILAVLGQTKTDAGRLLIEEALTHEAPAVRGAAAQALIAHSGEPALSIVLQAMLREASIPALNGFEDAVVSLRDQPSASELIRAKAIAALTDSAPPLRDSLVWLLAQVGGQEAMDTLAQALETQDIAYYEAVVNALSYSPDAAADKLILNAIRDGLKTTRAEIAAKEGVRRMVIGPQGLGQRPIESQLDYAQAVLEMLLNDDTIAYLGRIKTGRCAFILQKAMRRGAPASAAQAIIQATSDLSKADKKDRQLAESVLVDVIEFIEVTYIRGTSADFVKKSKDEQMLYLSWKMISAQAGKNLLKLTEQKEPAPLPEFDDRDLDF